MIKDPGKIKWGIDEVILAIGNVDYKCAPFIIILATDWVTTQMTFKKFYFWRSVQQSGHCLEQPCGFRGSLRISQSQEKAA